MWRHVLVGVNEQPGGRDAIALGKDLLAEGGELTLAHVHLSEAKPTRGSNPDFNAAERQRSRELLEAARTESGVDAALAWTGSPSVGRGLHELAERLGADLLVVGSNSYGLLGRVMIGDDTRDALNGAPCAVAVAPAAYSERPVHWREIGVGYDGSPESEHALEVAREMASELGAKVSAFQAVSLPFSGPGAGEVRLVHGSSSQRLAHTARCPLLVLSRATKSSGDPRTIEAEHIVSQVSTPKSAKRLASSST
jgi:nucleotide-binding universal stress UspA family protein